MPLFGELLYQNDNELGQSLVTHAKLTIILGSVLL